jgi:hypothetical protein
VIKFDFIFF